MPRVPHKDCIICGVNKPATNQYFPYRDKKREILRNECKVCSNNRKREYRKALPVHYYLHKQYLCIKAEKRTNRIQWTHNIDFTKFFIYKLYLQQGKKCALSGIAFDNQQHKPSMDRIDSTKGYTKDNIQIVSSMVNFMKQGYNQNDFINMCKMIAEKNG